MHTSFLFSLTTNMEAKYLLVKLEDTKSSTPQRQTKGVRGYRGLVDDWLVDQGFPKPNKKDDFLVKAAEKIKEGLEYVFTSTNTVKPYNYEAAQKGRTQRPPRPEGPSYGHGTGVGRK